MYVLPFLLILTGHFDHADQSLHTGQRGFQIVNQVVELHIGAVFQHAELIFHQRTLTLFFLLTDTLDVVLIVDQNHQQNRHRQKQHTAH